MRRLIIWGGAAALALLAYLRWARPAQLTTARVTALAPGTPPTASVVLTYGSGALPARVIVDLADAAGNGGSATVDGDQVLLDVPLIGAPTDSYDVTITATYRRPGRLLTRIRTFTADSTSG